MTREEAIDILNDERIVIWTEPDEEEIARKQNEAIDMAIEALSQPNYETDTEVRLAVTNRKKEKVILWDAYGEVEYYPIEALSAEPTDLISREEAIKEIENRIGLAWTESEANYNRGMEMALSIIEALPSASAEKHQLFGETSTNTSTNTSSGDLISRAEAHKVLSELSTEGGKDAKMLFMDAHEWIDAIPSADIPTKCIAQINIDADEVVQKIKGEYEIADRPSGEWVKHNDRSTIITYYTCSECGEVESGTPPHCRKCGAKMGSDAR